MLDGMVGAHTLSALQVPQLHHQLFLIAIMKARQEQFGEAMYGEKAPEFSTYVGITKRGAYTQDRTRKGKGLNFDPKPSHPFYY